MERKQRAQKLSQREEELLRLAGQGLTDAMIGEDLGLGQSTVATYWTRIRLKMGASSRTEAVALYSQLEIDRLNRELDRLKRELDDHMVVSTTANPNPSGFAHALNSHSIGVAVIQNDRVVLTNEGLEKLTNLHSRDLLMMSSNEFFQLVNPNYRITMLAKSGNKRQWIECTSLVFSRSNGRSRDGVYMFRSLKEELIDDRWALASIPMEVDSNMLVGVIGKIPFGIAVCDSCGAIAFQNTQFTELIRYPANPPEHQDQAKKPLLSRPGCWKVLIEEFLSSGIDSYSKTLWFFDPPTGRLLSYQLQIRRLEHHVAIRDAFLLIFNDMPQASGEVRSATSVRGR